MAGILVVKQKHVVFCTYEFHPVNPGGAGVLIAGLATMLARGGTRVTVLCGFPQTEVARLNLHLIESGLSADQIHAVQWYELVRRSTPSPALSEFEVNTELFAKALAALHAKDPIDLVEFPEYGGMACGSLRARREGTALLDVSIVVRAHGSLEIIEKASETPPSEEAMDMFAMEREAVRDADAVIGPSKALLDYYSLWYDLASDRAHVGEPPMEFLLKDIHPAGTRHARRAHFLLYGKLQEVKGVDIFVDAAVFAATSSPDVDFKFTLVGRDIYCGKHKRMTSVCLEEKIPHSLRHRFHFVSAISRDKLGELVLDVAAAVIPSRFESFCLAAHELRAVRVPLLVPRLAGFEQHLSEETGCLRYDGSALGLASAMRLLAERPEIAERLESARQPTYASWSAPYETLLQVHLGSNPA